MLLDTWVKNKYRLLDAIIHDDVEAVKREMDDCNPLLPKLLLDLIAQQDWENRRIPVGVIHYLVEELGTDPTCVPYFPYHDPEFAIPNDRVRAMLCRVAWRFIDVTEEVSSPGDRSS